MKFMLSPVFFGILCWCAAPAFAGGNGAPANPSSDFGSKELTVKVRHGKIAVRNGELAIHAGPFEAGLDASKKYHIWSERSNNELSAGVLIEPSIHGRIAAFHGSVRDTRIEAGVGGFGYFSVARRHELPEKAQQRAGLAAEYEQALSGLANAEYESNEELRRLLTEKAQEQIDAVLKKIAAAGFSYRLRFHSDCYENICIAPLFEETSATGDLKVVTLNGVYADDRDLGIKTQGLFLKGPDGSFHVAGRFNEVNVDVCGQLTPIALIVGRVEGKRKSYESAASLCAGVELGRVGHLGHEMRAKTDWKGFWQISNETSLKNIGDIGLGISHTHEFEQDQAGKRITRDLINASYAF